MCLLLRTSELLEKGDFGKSLAEEAPNFRIILGEYDIHRANGNITRMNLYDLPVSLEIFHIFVAQKIVGTGRAVYPLLQFTFDLIKFVMDKTQGVFGKAAEHMPGALRPPSFKMDMTSIDLPTSKLQKAAAESGDIIKLKSNGGEINTLNVTKIKDTSNTFVLHAQRRAKAGESSIYNGSIIEDIPRGIFHFFVGGPSRGLLKKIDFTQAGNTLFATALMREGQSGGAESSRDGVIQPSKFACELTLVGNPFFFIGQMFYVNTELISGGAFRENGILNGGYYIVTEVTSEFTNDRWETKVKGVLNIPDHALAKYKEGDETRHTTLASLSAQEAKRVTDAQSRAVGKAADATRPGANKNKKRVEGSEPRRFDRRGREHMRYCRCADCSPRREMA